MNRVPLHNLYVAHLLTPLAEGSRIKMHRWPPHVTLASNFFTSAEPGLIAQQLAEVAQRGSPFEVTLGSRMQYGQAGEYTVLPIARTAALTALHESLSRIVSNCGWYETPEFSGESYNPHLTIQPGWPYAPGDRLVISEMTLFDIDVVSNQRAVVRNFELPAEDKDER